MLKLLFNISLIFSLTGVAIMFSRSPQPSSDILKLALDKSTLGIDKKNRS
jgi:hypothetical protein